MAQAKTSDFSPAAIKRAILSASLQHPSVVYPAALGVLGGIGASLLSGGAFAAGAALIGGGVAAASLLVNYWARREVFASRYLEQAYRTLVQVREQTLSNLEADLKELGSSEGSQQLRRFRDKIEAFEDVLGSKFGRQELTYGRFMGIAEQVYLSGIDNLHAIALTLKGVRSIDENYVRQRIRKLEDDPATSPAEEQELAGLNSQLDLLEKQRGKIDGFLALNEKAFAQLDASIAAVTDIHAGDGQASLDMETAMQELARIAEQAREYSVR